MNDDVSTAATDHSLLRMLGDGTAGAPTRLMISLAAGAFLAGVACIVSYILGYWFPLAYRTPVSSFGRTTSYVSDEVAAVSFLLVGFIYLGVLYWIWSRHRRMRVIWIGASLTFGITLVAILVCVVVTAWFGGDEEFLVSGILLGAGGVIVAVWTHLYHRHISGRALYDETGTLALRCPACNYSMVGLKESRCPECGREYTLDELLARQDFEVLRLRSELCREKNPS